MQFKTYFFSLATDARRAFAEKVGTSVGHLNNVAYGYTKLAPIACVAVEIESARVVMRWDLLPDDWYRIWPELIGIEGAPEVPATEEKVA